MMVSDDITGHCPTREKCWTTSSDNAVKGLILTTQNGHCSSYSRLDSGKYSRSKHRRTSNCYRMEASRTSLPYSVTAQQELSFSWAYAWQVASSMAENLQPHSLAGLQWIQIDSGSSTTWRRSMEY